MECHHIIPQSLWLSFQYWDNPTDAFFLEVPPPPYTSGQSAPDSHSILIPAFVWEAICCTSGGCTGSRLLKDSLFLSNSWECGRCRHRKMPPSLLPPLPPLPHDATPSPSLAPSPRYQHLLKTDIWEYLPEGYPYGTSSSGYHLVLPGSSGAGSSTLLSCTHKTDVDAVLWQDTLKFSDQHNGEKLIPLWKQYQLIGSFCYPTPTKWSLKVVQFLPWWVLLTSTICN